MIGLGGFDVIVVVVVLRVDDVGLGLGVEQPFSSNPSGQSWTESQI